MAIGRDRVQPAKYESLAGGGAAADERRGVPVPIRPQQDAGEFCGVYLQDESNRDFTTYVARHGNDLIFRDKASGATYTFATLLAAVTFVNARRQVFFAASTSSLGFTTTSTTVLFETQLMNVGSNYTYNATGEVTVAAAGTYKITAQVQLARGTGSGGTEGRYWVEVGGVEMTGSSTIVAMDNAAVADVGACIVVATLSAGAVVRVRAVRKSGAGAVYTQPSSRLLIERLS